MSNFWIIWLCALKIIYPISMIMSSEYKRHIFWCFEQFSNAYFINYKNCKNFKQSFGGEYICIKMQQFWLSFARNVRGNVKNFGIYLISVKLKYNVQYVKRKIIWKKTVFSKINNKIKKTYIWSPVESPFCFPEN